MCSCQVPEAMTSAKHFCDKVTCVGANAELSALMAKITDMEAQLAARSRQYTESAIIYAVGHLQDPKSDKDPESMRNILNKQIAIATGNQQGFTQDSIHPLLWKAAVEWSEK